MEKIELHKVVFNIKELPSAGLPEIVLCGRSNVGKSSFINSLFNKKNLAKTSSTPGKTRSINYFLVNNTYFLVDLPGYGFAKASKTDKEKWERLINDYFNASKNIFLAVHLIDSRHSPTALDITMNNYLDSVKIPTLVVLTKADKLNQAEKSKTAKQAKAILPQIEINVNSFFYSSLSGTGHKEVMNFFKKSLQQH
jgi:GTP-binding protein